MDPLYEDIIEDDVWGSLWGSVLYRRAPQVEEIIEVPELIPQYLTRLSN